MNLVYSGARQGMVCDSFCKVGSGGFTVTPAGDVTACYEVSYASDPRSKRFFYGRFDCEAGDFVFDEGQARRAFAPERAQLPVLRDCFCRWHCAGDCAAKVLDGIELAGPLRKRALRGKPHADSGPDTAKAELESS